MKPHKHPCRICWEFFDCDCSFPEAEFGVCPKCRLRATFDEAETKWKGIAV